MAKHLTKADVEAIINIIQASDDEKMTWEAICQAASKVVGKKPTRQSLNENILIKEAYKVKKSGLKIHGPRTAMPSSLKVAAARIAKQQSEIDRLKSQNTAFKEQFVKWQYNAYKHGMREHQLNEPMPKIDRERTDKTMV